MSKLFDSINIKESKEKSLKNRERRNTEFTMECSREK